MFKSWLCSSYLMIFCRAPEATEWNDSQESKKRWVFVDFDSVCLVYLFIFTSCVWYQYAPLLSKCTTSLGYKSYRSLHHIIDFLRKLGHKVALLFRKIFFLTFPMNDVENFAPLPYSKENLLFAVLNALTPFFKATKRRLCSNARNVFSILLQARRRKIVKYSSS